jgi:hypothetical protein
MYHGSVASSVCQAWSALRRRMLLVLITAAIPLPGNTENRASAADPTVEEIRAALVRYTTVIETLRGKQIIMYQRSKVPRAPDGPVIMEDLRLETDFKTDFVHGRTSLAENRSWYYRDISPDPYTSDGQISCFNGKAHFALHVTPGRQPLPDGAQFVGDFPRNAPYVLMITPRDHTSENHLAWQLAGLPCSGPRVTWAQMLEASDARVGKRRMVLGAECVEVSATVAGFRIEAALDPEAGWLPREYRATPEGLRSSYEQTVREFKQFPIHGTDEKIWFPVKGRRNIRMGADTLASVDITVSELQVNVPMEKNEFEVDLEKLPPGVQVHSSGRVRYTGGRKDLFDAIDKAVDERSAAMQAKFDQVRAGKPK